MKSKPHILSLSRPLNFLKKLRFHEILLIILIFAVLAAWGTKKVTESAVFCGNSCHVMRPQYEEWKVSSHKDVACVKCHIPPRQDQQFYPDFRALGRVLNYLTRTYGRYTRAEVEDSSCLREGCHSRRLLEGSVEYTDDITFNHTPHLQQLRRGKILRCSTCHARTVMGEHIAVVKDICFICHFKGDRSKLYTAQCVLCHKTDRLAEKKIRGGFRHGPYIERTVPCNSCHAGIISGNGEQDAEACIRCHGPSYTLNPEESSEALHRTHVTQHKVECDICHLPIRHEIPAENAVIKTNCGSCHENRHAGIMSMYRGEGANGVQSDPSPMYLKSVACIGCHRVSAQGDPSEVPFRGDTLIAVESACSQCHGTDMSGRIEKWKAETVRAMDLAEKALARVEAYIGGLKAGGIDEETERILRESRHNILFVRASSPIHNHEYALAVLEKTTADLNSIMTTATQR